MFLTGPALSRRHERDRLGPAVAGIAGTYKKGKALFKFNWRIATVSAAALAVIGGGSAALASVNPVPVNTSNGEAGYYASGQPERSITANLNLPASALDMVPTAQPITGSTVIGDAEGIQLCHSTTGDVAQLGVTDNPGSPVSTFTVDFVYGKYSTLSPNPCIHGGVVHGADVTTNGVMPGLGAVPVNHNLLLTIRLGEKCKKIRFWGDQSQGLNPWNLKPNSPKHEWGWGWGGCKHYGNNRTLIFQSADLTAGSPVVTVSFHLGSPVSYDEAGAGVQRTVTCLQPLSNGAQTLGQFTQVLANGAGLGNVQLATAVQSQVGSPPATVVAPDLIPAAVWNTAGLPILTAGASSFNLYEGHPGNSTTAGCAS
jgi:hypothetical protein